jgi:cysteine desulfurase
MNPIYLDYNATTPVDSRVLDAMLPWFTDRFWNAASAHGAGESARLAVEVARSQTAELIGARRRELVFTSGSTEANNLALKGLAATRPHGRDTVLVSAIEHKAVIDTANWLATQGLRLRVIPVDADGRLDLDALQSQLDGRVLLVSLMFANNETGVVQPVAEAASLAHDAGALLHTDATQAVGKVPVDVTELNVDLLSLSAHKFYGPKGIGGLYVRRGIHLQEQLHGGGHEAGLRSGTLNVPGAVGMGAAANLSASELADEAVRVSELTTQLVHGLSSAIRGVTWLGGAKERLPNTACLRFAGADAEAVMANAPTVMVSSGSACTSRVPEPSHVLTAMGLSREEAYQCIRFSLGRGVTRDQITSSVAIFTSAVNRVRSLTMNNSESILTPEGTLR